MYRIKTMNKISPKGLEKFDRAHYEVGDLPPGEHAILLRSASLHEYDFPPELLAIARAGAGFNNIPIERAADAGIVVFNTPGANANAVKELALAALLLCARDIAGGIQWIREEAAGGTDIAAVVEQGKARFAGSELAGKTLGILGLGAIGAQLASAALDLGMDVVGYDPYLSLPAALRLDPRVRLTEALPTLYAAADYISLHLPMSEDTKGMLNAEAFSKMKEGVSVLNLSRGELVDDDAMAQALSAGKVRRYASDFPTTQLACLPGVLPTPHLGASTGESEENCAVMAALQLRNYIEHGNIVNSVNYPNLSLESNNATRICVLFRAAADGSDPASAVTAALTDANVRIEAMASRVREGYGYLLLDTRDALPAETLAALREMDGVLRLRIIEQA